MSEPKHQWKRRTGPPALQAMRIRVAEVLGEDTVEEVLKDSGARSSMEQMMVLATLAAKIAMEKPTARANTSLPKVDTAPPQIPDPNLTPPQLPKTPTSRGVTTAEKFGPVTAKYKELLAGGNASQATAYYRGHREQLQSEELDAGGFSALAKYYSLGPAARGVFYKQNRSQIEAELDALHAQAKDKERKDP